MKDSKYNQTHESHAASCAIIYQSELDYISRCIQDYPHIETGGQLFGFVTETGEPVVCYALGPGPRANHQVTFFNQDETYLEHIYGMLNRIYGLRYIGEWHSHHQLGLARPSGHDASTVVHGMQDNGFFRFLLCIGNCDAQGRTTLNAFTFHIDAPYDYYHAPWKVLDMESPYRSLIDKDLDGQFCHPKTQKAYHGLNYVVTESETSQTTTPKYQDDYWLNTKENNLILKKIIDYLTGLEENCTVASLLDESYLVNLVVQRSNGQQVIIFGKNFPNEAPQILIDEKMQPGNVLEWESDGSIYERFVRYYDLYTQVGDFPSE